MTNRHQRMPVWVGILIIAAVFAFSGTIWTIRYRECRAHGFSRFYCAMSK